MTTHTDAASTITTFETLHHGSIHSMTVWHRDFPEVQCEGASVADAAERLATLLFESLEHAPSVWRREAVERAIDDVRAFSGEVHGNR